MIFTSLLAEEKQDMLLESHGERLITSTHRHEGTSHKEFALQLKEISYQEWTKFSPWESSPVKNTLETITSILNLVSSH